MIAISIHAPLAGSDFTGKFNAAFHVEISIHAPLAGSDV